jgi:hypothetical protein
MHSAETPSLSSTQIDVGSEHTSSNRGYRQKAGHSSDKGVLFRNEKPFRSDKPSMSNRVARSVGLALFAVLVSVGGTLACQSYRDEIIRVFPPFGWFSPVPAVTSADLQEQLRPLAIDLALVRRSIEQLTANLDQLARKQDQLAQNMAMLQAAEPGVSSKVPAVPLPPKTVYAPPPPPESLRPPGQ